MSTIIWKSLFLLVLCVGLNLGVQMYLGIQDTLYEQNNSYPVYLVTTAWFVLSCIILFKKELRRLVRKLN